MCFGGVGWDLLCKAQEWRLGVWRLIPGGGEMSEAKGKGRVVIWLVLRIGCVLVAARSCLLKPTGAYWGVLRPTVISISIWSPVSIVLFVCYCLERHCVLKSLVIPEYDGTISSASTTKIYAYLSVARNMANVLTV